MTQEEKAKKYDEVVCKLRRFMEQGIDPLITRADVQDFFPELKESEDEKIRKKIIDYFRGSVGLGVAIGGVSVKDMVSWLEKQGELVNSLSKGLDNAHERIDELIQKNNKLCIKLEQKAEWKQENVE